MRPTTMRVFTRTIKRSLVDFKKSRLYQAHASDAQQTLSTLIYNYPKYPPCILHYCDRQYSTEATAPRPDDMSSSLLPANTNILEVYRGIVAQGKLKWDDEQVRCVVKVHLFELIKHRSPSDQCILPITNLVETPV